MEGLKSNQLKGGGPPLDWAIASAPLPGQTESGDRFLVEEFVGGALVAVVDALGHGPLAAQVAQRAIETLARHASDSVGALIHRCHELSGQRRGATISLASFDWRWQQMEWLGVGNVMGVLVPHPVRPDRPVRHLLVRAGVVGGNLPDLHPTSVGLARGDTLIVHTDGIDERFSEDMGDDLTPQPLAERILAQYSKRTDDALVLVARYGALPHGRGS